MSSYMAGISALANGAVLIRRSICIYQVRTVVLLVSLAVVTGQVCPNLRANSNTITNFDSLHFGAYFDCLPNDLVTYTQRSRKFAPSSADGVNIRATYPASVDSNINIIVFERLEFELYRRQWSLREW
jgi:hypothetical protein